MKSATLWNGCAVLAEYAEENKKSKDMLEKIIIEQRKGQRFEMLTQLE